MKTTKRSKMLLSSIAMLLVALVALGSATYAWYTLNHTVTADDVSVKASSPEGLMISNDNSTWKTSLEWTDSLEAAPSSIKFTAPTNTMTAASDIIDTMVKAEAAEQDAATMKANGQTTITSANYGSYAVMKTFYVKSTGKTDLTDVKATLAADVGTGVTIGNTYVNAVLVDFTDQEVLAAVYSGGTMDGYMQTSGSKANFASPYNVWAEATSTETSGHTYSQDNEHVLGIVVYVDGQNAKCTTDTPVTDDVNFTVSFSSAQLGA